MSNYHHPAAEAAGVAPSMHHSKFIRSKPALLKTAQESLGHDTAQSSAVDAKQASSLVKDAGGGGGLM